VDVITLRFLKLFFLGEWGMASADRWVITCKADGKLRVTARTGKRGAMPFVGTFTDVQAARDAAEAAIAAGPVEKARRGGKMPVKRPRKPQSAAEAVAAKVRDILDEPKPPPPAVPPETEDFPWM
jgi:hypothetical protein